MTPLPVAILAVILPATLGGQQAAGAIAEHMAVEMRTAMLPSMASLV